MSVTPAAVVEALAALRPNWTVRLQPHHDVTFGEQFFAVCDTEEGEVWALIAVEACLGMTAAEIAEEILDCDCW